MDISKIEHFLEYIINMSFSYDAIQDAQYSLDKELDIYEDE